MTMRTILLCAALMATTACVPLAAQPSVVSPAASAEACDKPVILVVWIENLDRSKSKAYGDALRSSGIVRRNGGEYIAVSPPTMVLEGEWPLDRGFVTERYPCMDAFRAMWFSEEYQNKLKPLREGSGRYTIALFDERPRPAPATRK